LNRELSAPQANASVTTRLTPFRKILIANRGEIARRVIRTARAMGYQTVAIYSTADEGAIHVREADQAVHVGGSLPSESYLDIGRLIDAAVAAQADAVHPGYGFLSENAMFAQTCRNTGLVFIGPSSEAIRVMGSKSEAKRLMQSAGITCIPGYQGHAQDESTLSREAQKLGFPLMIKAAAGGGGRGIRLVTDAEQFVASLRSARSEAQGAFGDTDVILERAISNPRHIEIQIMADRYGGAVHLGERDCSVQRRHQKLIEEAPSSAVSQELRERMGASAVAVAKAIQYEGAGTVEYLLDDSGDFYFMEMNTRLQVEHPVTEMTTGLDLVEMQLRVAAGDPLQLAQQDVHIRGHSIEVRLCAEDSARAFIPQSGTLCLWRPPASVRVDHALESGTEISPFYDAMIAKLIGVGRTRDEARHKLIAALYELVALGVVTNQKFLRDCLSHPAFVDGAPTTAFIETHATELLRSNAAGDLKVLSVAAILMLTLGPVRTTHGPPSLPLRWPVRNVLDIDGVKEDVEVLSLGNDVFRVMAASGTLSVSILAVDSPQIRFECNGVVETAVAAWRGEVLFFHYSGCPHRVENLGFRPTSSKDATHDGTIRASMNGRIIALHAEVGQVLQPGQSIFTIEAMKMEHVHTAPVGGRLVSLAARVGQQVAAARIVATIEPATPATAPSQPATPVDRV
jgi:geranyl-CoA carboxylase alpha subunit